MDQGGQPWQTYLSTGRPYNQGDSDEFELSFEKFNALLVATAEVVTLSVNWDAAFAAATTPATRRGVLAFEAASEAGFELPAPKGERLFQMPKVAFEYWADALRPLLNA